MRKFRAARRDLAKKQKRIFVLQREDYVYLVPFVETSTWYS
jgi:hypothetical protein